MHLVCKLVLFSVLCSSVLQCCEVGVESRGAKIKLSPGAGAKIKIRVAAPAPAPTSSPAPFYLQKYLKKLKKNHDCWRSYVNCVPDPAFYLDADPDPYPTPSFTHAGKAEILLWLFHSSSKLHFLVSFIGLKIFSILDNVLNFSGKKFSLAVHFVKRIRIRQMTLIRPDLLQHGFIL